MDKAAIYTTIDQINGRSGTMSPTEEKKSCDIAVGVTKMAGVEITPANVT